MNSQRAAPPQGAPGNSPFVQRVFYRRNLRPYVIFFAFISALYSLFAAIGGFRSISIDKQEQVPKIATISLVLGILYITITAFEVFGLVAAWTQRTVLVRIYAMLAAATTLIVIGSGLLRIVTHFTLKNDIIGECTNLSKDQNVLFYPFGYWGPTSHTFIDEDDARRWCTNAWDHDSWADIVSLLILIVLSGLMTTIAYSYYRQVLDPTSVVNVQRVPARPANGGWANSYNPPYGGYNGPNLGYNAPYGAQPYQPYPQYPQPQGGGFAPPPGPPPNMQKPEEHIGADGNAGATYANSKENPFADFDEPAGPPPATAYERDVTSRPGPGGKDTF